LTISELNHISLHGDKDRSNTQEISFEVLVLVSLTVPGFDIQTVHNSRTVVILRIPEWDRLILGRACKFESSFLLVPGGGVEPPRPEGRRILSPLRLPVPPSRLGWVEAIVSLIDRFQLCNVAIDAIRRRLRGSLPEPDPKDSHL
jgi:hypothetical protein